jgi:5-methylcytosine-specific restriction protein B
MVTEVQFHPAYGYDEFIEGLRIDASGAVVERDGVFMEVNRMAAEDPDHTYVLLIEEFTRANVHAVLGEALTYIEHRDRPMTTLYRRLQVRVQKNLRVIATYNPSDRTALDLDAALLRRLRIIDFPPDTQQLEEMLASTTLSVAAKKQLTEIFSKCEAAFRTDYASQMPFGHGIFAEVENESPDLHDLWRERIVHLLRRPQLEPHPFTDVIEANYPWRDSAYVAAPAPASAHVATPADATGAPDEAVTGGARTDPPAEEAPEAGGDPGQPATG